MPFELQHFVKLAALASLPLLGLSTVHGCRTQTTDACTSDDDCSAREVCTDEGRCSRLSTPARDNGVESGNQSDTDADSGETYAPETDGGVEATGCVSLEPVRPIEFDGVAPGASGARTLRVGHCRRVPDEPPVRIRGIEIRDDDDGAFELRRSTLPDSLAEGGDVVLQSGEGFAIDIHFEPPQAGSYTAKLRIQSSDPAKPSQTFELRGESSEGDCPTAVARAQTDTSGWSDNLEVDPLTTVQLSAADSTAPAGSVERYAWRLVERPAGSTTTFAPSPTIEEPELQLDVVGEYRLQLEAFDENGTVNCEPTYVTLRASNPHDVYVEVVWYTPSDRSPRDNEGPDLDLHYRNARGDWNDGRWDVFWDNTNPDWGDEDDSSDDPTLLVDDTGGAGPEAVAHDNLEQGREYHVGVAYYDDHGFGPTYATVRIYSGEELAHEFSDKFLEPDVDLWHVAKFEGDLQNFQIVDKFDEL